MIGYLQYTCAIIAMAFPATLVTHMVMLVGGRSPSFDRLGKQLNWAAAASGVGFTGLLATGFMGTQ